MTGCDPVRIAIDRSSPGMLWGFLDIHACRTPGGLLMAPAHVDGVSVEAVIDTGSADTLGNFALREVLPARGQLGASTPIYGVIHQISVGATGVAPILMLGPAEIEHLPSVYSDVPNFRAWHLEPRPAVIIGVDVLGRVDNLALEYPRARIYIPPAPALQKCPDDSDRDQIRVGAERREPVVLGPHAPATDVPLHARAGREPRVGTIQGEWSRGRPRARQA